MTLKRPLESSNLKTLALIYLALGCATPVWAIAPKPVAMKKPGATSQAKSTEEEEDEDDEEDDSPDTPASAPAVAPTPITAAIDSEADIKNNKGESLDDEDAESSLQWTYQQWTLGVTGSLSLETHRNNGTKGLNNVRGELDPVFEFNLDYALENQGHIIAKIDSGWESWRQKEDRKLGNRELYLGYQSAEWGTVKLGTNGSPSWRVLDQVYGTAGLNWPISYSGYGRLNVLRLADWVKNTLAYSSPEWQGFSGEASILLTDNLNDHLKSYRDIVLHYQIADQLRIDSGFVYQQSTQNHVAPLRTFFFAGQYQWQDFTLSAGVKWMAQTHIVDTSIYWSQLGYEFGPHNLHFGLALTSDNHATERDTGTSIIGAGYAFQFNDNLSFYSELTWAKNKAGGGIGASDADVRYSLGGVTSSQWINGMNLSF